MTARNAAYWDAAVLSPGSTVSIVVPIVSAIEESLVASPPRSSVLEIVVLEPQGGEADPTPDDQTVTCSEEVGQTHVVEKGWI